MKNTKFLIIGHPRCGTGYMSKLFKLNGFDVGHEIVGDNGVSDWQYAIENDKCFSWTNGCRNDYTFDVIIHNVRDPFTALNSIIFTENYHFSKKPLAKVSEDFRKKHIGFIENNEYDDAASSFLGWNKIIEDQNIKNVARIEHAFEDLKDLNYLKEDLPNKKVNSRKHRTLNKDEWNKISPENIEKLEKFCEHYGYDSIKERISNIETK